jgi:hypothetical protein
MRAFGQRRLGAARRAALGGFAAALVAALATAALATAQSLSKPSNVSPPTISGTAARGSTLTASPGTWNGSPAPSFAYQWQRCNASGGSCAAISGATQSTYTPGSADRGNTLRVHVRATNSAGSSSSTSVPTAVVARAATSTSTTTSSQSPATGCPTLAQGAQAVDVNDVTSPARLQIAGFTPTPGIVHANMQSFSVAFHVTDTCGDSVQGASVYATAVPYNQVTVPAATPTDSTGWVTLTFYRRAGFPASPKQELMVMFIRASKPGQSVLAGITTERLVSFPVDLKS